MQPAWVIHRRPYGDTSFLVELFTVDMGRLTAVVRGARRRSRGGSSAGLAQPFIPLLVDVTGRGELKTLRRMESVSAGISLPGEAMFSGLYLNELITRVLPRFDPHPRLFAHYGALLPELASAQAGLKLRRFEFELLDELGYGFSFDHDAHGDAVEPDREYWLEPNQGWLVRVFGVADSALPDGVVYRPNSAASHHDAVLDDAYTQDPARTRTTGVAQHPLAARGQHVSAVGADLHALSCWWQEDCAVTEGQARLLKAVARRLLAQHLGDQPLRSRELLRAFLKGAKTSDTGETLS